MTQRSLGDQNSVYSEHVKHSRSDLLRGGREESPEESPVRLRHGVPQSARQNFQNEATARHVKVVARNQGADEALLGASRILSRPGKYQEVK